MTHETTLERNWRESGDLGSFAVISHEIYNGTYGCRSQTPVLQCAPDNAQTELLTDITPTWVAEEMARMVREEGQRHHSGHPHVLYDVCTVTEQIVYDLLAEYERRLGEHAERILEDPRHPTLESKIEAMLCDPTLGNKENRKDATIAEIRGGVQRARKSGGPLVFLLPAFPFKDQNPFRSDLPPWQPDFGEVAALIHLHCLALAINQVFRHDVIWLIVSDGTVYEDVFGVDRGASAKYVSALRDWRYRLNIQGSIHFIDLADVVRRHDVLMRSTQRLTFTDARRSITEIIRSDPGATGALELQASVGELALGMLWNRGWSHLIPTYGRDVLWQIHSGPCEREHRHSPSCAKARLPPEYLLVADEMWRTATDTAIEYAAFNLASRWTRLLPRFMPAAIRATSHAKAGQVAIPHDTGVAPWNGLAVYERRGGTVRVYSQALCQIPVTVSGPVRFQIHNAPYGFGFASREAITYYL